LSRPRALASYSAMSAERSNSLIVVASRGYTDMPMLVVAE
jgi:hypothetical protein